MNKPTSFRLSPELKAKITTLADARGVSVSAIVTAALEQYLDTERVTDELHAMEDRLAATLTKTHRETARAGDDIQLLIALLDGFIRFVTIATPEVVDKKAAGILGQRRYRGLLDELKGSITTRGRATILERLAESHEERVQDDQHE